jgi:hypothetical protein
MILLATEAESPREGESRRIKANQGESRRIKANQGESRRIKANQGEGDLPRVLLEFLIYEKYHTEEGQ